MTEPAQPSAPETEAPPEVRLAEAGQWTLMRRRFRRHKLAVVSLWLLFGMYLLAAFCEFVSPYAPDTRNIRYLWGGPQRVRFVRPDGRFAPRPFVHGYRRADLEDTWSVALEPDPARIYEVRFFVRGEPYRMWGLWETDRHLFGVRGADGQPGFIHLLGTDRQGRDMFTRVLYGARISLTIGLVGVAMTFVLGVVIGGIAGYAGGVTDLVVQRIMEVLQSVPSLPLWMGLSAALPATWSGVRVYFGVTIILGIIGWTGLARIVRGKFLALREEDYIVAARLLGASRGRVVFRHMLPGFMSHIITAMTLSIPGMILGETALSFLGIGLRPPVVSWGVLLQQAQNTSAMVLMPWLLIPGLFVVLTVLAFNLVGDGLRDAADPYN